MKLKNKKEFGRRKFVSSKAITYFMSQCAGALFPLLSQK
jgi:hypothetical protein